MMRTLRRTAAAIAVSTAALGIAASAASAGELSASGSVVTYQAYAGETNHVTVSQAGSDVTVSDTAGVDLGVGCTGNPRHCELAGVSKVIVNLGNGNDSLSASAVDSPMEVDGDAGDDTILAGAANDVVYGSTGDDTLSGSLGNDHLLGNTGDDRLNGNAGNDTLEGGDGNDTLDGGAGVDKSYGNAGSDVITSVDNTGGEEIDCGWSVFNDDDFAKVDSPDIVRSNCERVQRF